MARPALTLLLLPLTLLLAAAPSCLATDKYTDQFDHVNVDAILANERLLNNYLQCFLQDTDERCTEDGKMVKDVMEEALHTDCAKCTEKQKEAMRKVVPFLARNRPADWKALAAKYDPNGVFSARHPEWVNPA